MNLQVLVSTMHQIDHSLIKKMKIQSDTIVINQCNNNKEDVIKKGELLIKWVNSTERGLSRSRNSAIKYSNGDICLLSDDDLEYVSGYEKIILEKFKQHPEADIISFQVEGIEEKFKNYYPKSRKLNYLTLMKVSSVEIAFRLESIEKAGVTFNELFGAGSKFFMGEESIFLTECLKHGLKIIYIPVKIANLHIGESTWFKGYNKEYFVSKGAAFTAMSKVFSVFFIIQFAIRRSNLFNDKLTKFEAIKYMLLGRKQFLGDTETNI